MTGGPPVRGTKLLAWRIPSVWKELQTNKVTAPKNSKVVLTQNQLLKMTLGTLAAIYADVRDGLRETVGTDCTLEIAERCSIILDLPPETDTELIARAIDLENVEAWCDSEKRVHVALNPWYSTKDVDQTVLCTIKVIHVLLGTHADQASAAASKSISQKVLTAVAEIINLQKSVGQTKRD